MKRAGAFCALIAATALAGCGGNAAKDEVPAVVVPPDAAAYVELDISPDGAAETAADRFLRRLVPGFGSGGARLRALVDRALRGAGGTYDKSVKPWIGDRVAVFLTPGGEQLGVVAEAEDPDRAWEAIEKLDVRGRPTEHRDARYRLIGGTLAAGVAGKWVVVAPEVVLRAAVDALHGRSLAELNAFGKAMKRIRAKDPIGRLWMDAATLAGQTDSARGSALGGVTGLTGANLGGALSLSPEAALIDVAAQKEDGAALGIVSPGDSLDEFPGDAWIAAAIGDFPSYARGQLRLASPRERREARELLAGTTGIDMGDLLRHADQSLNFAVRGTSDRKLGVWMAVEGNDSEATERLVRNARRNLERRTGIRARLLSHPEGVSLVLPAGPYGPGAEIATQLEVIHVFYGHPFNEARLAGRPSYRRAKAAFGRHIPTFWLDGQSLVDYLDSSIGEDAYEDARPWLDSLDFVATGLDDSSSLFRQRYVIGVRKGANPPNLELPLTLALRSWERAFTVKETGAHG